MNENLSETEDAPSDETWFELWKCRSLEELRLKAAILGVDFERWLQTDGYMWHPRWEEWEE